MQSYAETKRLKDCVTRGIWTLCIPRLLDGKSVMTSTGFLSNLLWVIRLNPNR